MTTTKRDITLINGHEIINFLNENLDELSEYNIVDKFEFESQEIHNARYKLKFNVGFNNWSEVQECYGEIYITDKNINVFLDEPLEGNGGDTFIIELLNRWIDTHTFTKDLDVKFYNLIQEVHSDLEKVKYTDVKHLTELIDKLVKAKTYMK